MAQPIDDEDLELGRKLFAGPCTFLRGVAALPQLPDTDLPEVCFAGRSNVGKSSLLNALTGRKALARTSNTPGRTREINFFDLSGKLWLVDLPGYGYARASKTLIQSWTQLVEDYLRGRASLRRACLLIDARHGLKQNDRTVMDMLDQAAVTYQIILTKCDKISATDCNDLLASLDTDLKSHPAAYPKIIATSARARDGIADLRQELAMLASPVAMV